MVSAEMARRIEALIEEVLTPERLDAWLAERPEGDVVGLARASDDCPLSRYLEHAISDRLAFGCEVFAHDEIEVYDALREVGVRNPPLVSRKTPGWALLFICELDAHHETWEDVTAGRARAALADRMPPWGRSSPAQEGGGP